MSIRRLLPAGQGALEAVHAGRGRISAIYLLDAAVEAVLLAAWGRLLLGGLSDDRERDPHA